MPEPGFILANLTKIANAARPLAIAWHAALVIGLVLLALGKRPRQRSVAWMLSLPLVSVGLAAVVFGNAFNAATFLLGAALLALLARGAPRERLEVSSPPWLALGLLTLLYGAIYPHFLGNAPWWQYGFAAPLGLLPCPTLAVVIGVVVACRGLGARGWATLLGVFGLCYGVFGVVRLGVLLDIGLAIAAGLLLMRTWWHRPWSAHGLRERSAQN